MSIVLIGGHDRMQEEYRSIGSRNGHRLKVFTQMPARFDKNIGDPDAIVLFTNTASHKMVLTAIREAKKKKIPVFRCHTSSGTSLDETLKSMIATA